MKDSGTELVVQATDDRYFLVKDEQDRFCICYRDDDGEMYPSSAIYKSIEYVPGMKLFVGTDVETDAVGIIGMHGEEYVPAVFQDAVICRDKIVLIDYNNKPYHIDIVEGKNVKDALKRFSKRLKLKDVYMMGKVAGNRDAQPVFRRNMREAILSEEKRWGFEDDERDAE